MRMQNNSIEKGSAPAPGAVRRASRLWVALEMDSPFSVSARLFVRPEAGRTAAEAAALPKKSTASFRPEVRASVNFNKI